MKRTTKVIALLLSILLLVSVLPAAVIFADFQHEIGAMTAAKATSGGITIDGTASAGETWDYAVSATAEDSNMGGFWGSNSRTVTQTELKFAYDSTGLYFFAKTFDDSPTRSTTTDSSHGWDGDVLILQLDPLKKVTAKGTNYNSPWYCFGLDASGNTLIYVLQAGSKNRRVAANGNVSAATTVDGNYVSVEGKIPWSTIVSDVKASDSAVSVTASAISAENAVHTAKIVYLNRWVVGTQPNYKSLSDNQSAANGSIVTLARSATVCDTIPGTDTPGTYSNPNRASTNGITLTLDAHTHVPGSWNVVSAVSCTTNGVRERYCTTCGALVDREVTEAYGHQYGEGVVVEEATAADPGVKRFTCTRCGESINETYLYDINLTNMRLASYHEEKSAIRVKFSVDENAGFMDSVVEIGGIVRNDKYSDPLEVDTDGNLTAARGQAKTEVFKNGTQVGNIIGIEDGQVIFTTYLYNLLTPTKDNRSTKYSFIAYAILENREGERSVVYTPMYKGVSYNKLICLSSSHTFDDGVVTLEPTYTSTGIMTYTCTRCGDTRTEEIDKLVNQDKKLVVTYYDAMNFGSLSSMSTADIKNLDIIYYTGYDIYGVSSTSLDIRAKINMTNATQIANAKSINPDLKVLMCLYANNTNFNACVADTATTNTAMKGICDVIDAIGFDGVDVDWEYPDGSDTQKTNTRKFFTALRAELDRRESQNNKEYLLTAAVPQGTWPFSLYDMATLADKCDYLNVMTYDSLISWQYTQHHTAPYDDPDWMFSASNQSVNSTIAYFTSQGIPAEKLLMGCGLYSVDWGSGIPDGGTHGLHQYAGRTYSGRVLVRYNELQGVLASYPEYKVYWDDVCKAMYLYDGSTFVSIDNDDSIKAKAEIVNNTGAGGLMLFCYTTFRNTSITTSVRNWIDGNTAYPPAIDWSQYYVN